MTSTFFSLHSRKMKLNSLPGHVADAIDAVVVEELVFSFPVRVPRQHFACCKLKAAEKTPCCSFSGCLSTLWWFTPPLSQGTVGRVVGGVRGCTSHNPCLLLGFSGAVPSVGCSF